jgi:hypothetical protein
MQHRGKEGGQNGKANREMQANGREMSYTFSRHVPSGSGPLDSVWKMEHTVGLPGVE